MFKSNYRSAVHHSAETRILEKPITDIREQVRHISRFLMFVSSNGTIDAEVFPGHEAIAARGMVDLRDSIGVIFGMPNNSFAIRLSVTSDEAVANEFRSRHKGLARSTLHTEYRVRGSSQRQGKGLHLPKHSRITAVFGGDGPIALQGDVRARRAVEFSPGLCSVREVEALMEQYEPTLLGVDGQIVRGPAADKRKFRLDGDFERVALSEGEWIELQPTTIHESAEYLHRGRAVLNIDRVESAAA